MNLDPIIANITLMLKYLDEGAIRAVYMIVKELYILSKTDHEP